MNTKRFLIALLAAITGLVTACSGTAPTPAPQAAVPTVEAPTAVPVSGPVAVVKSYYDALNVKSIDAAMAFIADDAVFANPTGLYVGKDEIRASLESLAADGITFELSGFRESGGRVVYDYRVLQGATLLDSGSDGLTIVTDGKITFDGTERTEASAMAVPASPDPISVVQSFYDALKAKDIDAAVALLADDARWRGTPTLTGKESIRVYLQSDMNAGWTTEVSDLRATKGRVTYTSSVFRNDFLQGSGEDTMVVVDGKITTIESYAFTGNDARPDIAEVAFTVSEYAFDGPDEIKAGWVKFALTGAGQEGHHLQLLKLEAGKTLDDVKAALTADPENFPAWATPYGGPNAPDPGGSTSAIVYLEAGSYALICVIPDAQGVPHFQHGMMKTLTVKETTGIMAGEPKPDITIDLADFSFTVTGSLTAGEHTIRFNNKGQQVHEAFLVKLADGKTAEDYLNTAPGTIPPGVSLGGITGIVPGDGQYIGVNLEPGNYALFCFFPDPTTHAPHFVQGMIQEFAVK